MNFGSLIGLANKNRIESTNVGLKAKCFSTAVSPAVKPVRRTGQSPNVRAFLEKQEQEKKEKAIDFKMKKEHLLTLRSQNSKNNKKAKIMASRTKDNDFSRIRLTEDQVEAKGKREAEIQRKMLTDKVERMKARIQLADEEALLPHKRKRKRKVDGPQDEDGVVKMEDMNYFENRREFENDERWPSHNDSTPPVKKKRPPPSQPVSFHELLKVAAQKQMQPESQESESDYEDEEERDRRPMTKKDLERYKELEMRRKGISVNDRAPQQRPKGGRGPNRPKLPMNATPFNDPGNRRVNGNVKMGQPNMHNNRPPINNNRQQPQKNFPPNERKLNPKPRQGQQQPIPQKSVRMESNGYPSTNGTHHQKEVQRSSSQRDSDRQKPVLKKSHPVDSRGGIKKPVVMPSNQMRTPSRPVHDKLGPTSQSRTLANSRNRLPPQRQQYSQNEEYEPDEEYVPQPVQKGQKGHPQNRSKENVSMASSQRLKNYPPEGQRSKEQLQRQRNPAGYSEQSGGSRNKYDPAHRNPNATTHPPDPIGRERFIGHQKQKTLSANPQTAPRRPLTQPSDTSRSAPLPSKSRLKDLNRTVPPSANRPSVSKSQPQMKGPFRTAKPEMVQERIPERLKTGTVMPKRPSANSASEPRRFQPSGSRDPSINRPMPNLPPIGHIRHKILGPRNPYGRLPSKVSRNYYESEEDDDEMNDFIDDGNNDECNEDYSKHIQDIFGYDRSRYAFEDDDDDDIVETTFAEQMKEEARSARIGLLEDLEDIRKEEQERKALIKMKKKKSV